VAGCCECGDEPSGSGATELVLSGVEGLTKNLRSEELFEC
jgi:hypothetical protein